MVEEWLAIFAAYGLGVCLVHGFMKSSHSGHREPIVVVVITRNCGLSVEWHLRSLALLGWLQGRPLNVTVLDEGSADDTVQIVGKMVSKAEEGWNMITCSSASEVEEWLSAACADTVIDLRTQRVEPSSA